MTSFSWKKKTGSSVKRDVSAAFEEDTKNENDQLKGVDWLTLVPHKKIVCLEDAVCKSSRLKDEGSLLAQSERYWEAIKKWDEALQLTPLDEKLYEMKAQALLVLCEVFPAVAMAEKAVNLKPTWWTSYQTLGRAQLGLGEVRQAIKSFSRAVHIHPVDEELWKEDLLWAFSLLKQKVDQSKMLSQNSDIDSKLKVTELIENEDVVKVTELIENEDVVKDTVLLHNDRQVLDYSESNMSETLQQHGSTEIKRLPHNYVYMRDT